MSTGYIHSIESGSFVDGPGTRFVVFLAGCPLRCSYCHNPDTWKVAGEQVFSADLLARISRFAAFLKAADGGVTVSGGEPLMQPKFALEVLAGSKALGLHTALDTSGCLGERLDEEMLAVTDLVLLDIKSYDPETYRKVTKGDVAPTLQLARRLSDLGKPMWVRFVLVPGLTDDAANVEGLARFVGKLTNVERVEVIPFHQMGEHKWADLGIPYTLHDTVPPTDEEIRRVKETFAAEGLPVHDGVFPTCIPAGRGG